MLSFGMLWARAERMALRSRAFPFGSPPPVLAAMLISRDSLLKSAPRFVSTAPLKRLTLDHLLCSDMRWESYEVAGQTCFLSGVGEPRRGLLSRRQINEGIKPPGGGFVNHGCSDGALSPWRASKSGSPFHTPTERRRYS